MDYVSPFDEQSREAEPLASRASGLDGARIALLDISKRRGEEFLDHVEARLRSAGAQVRRYRKPTFARPAPQDLIEEIARDANLVVEALAD